LRDHGASIPPDLRARDSYIGTRVTGAYMDYVVVVRTCNTCYVRRG